MSEAEKALERAEALVERLEEARRRLESTQDAEAATEVLSELAEIAREIETELAEARRRAARRTALFLLYQWDVTGQPLTSL